MPFSGAGTDASIRTLQHVPLDSGGFGFFVSKRACIYLVAGKIEGSYGKAARLTHRNPHPASAGWGSSNEDNVCDEIDASVLCDENYDLRQIWHLDKKPHKEDGEDFVNGVFLYAEKQGSVVLNSPDDAYKDLSEMADEFRKTYGAYLSDDFDYTAHLCYMLGASFRQLR